MERREAPRVEIYPEPAQRVSTGQSVLFQCRVTAGIPNPVVRWTRPGGSSQFERNVEIMDGGVIRYLNTYVVYGSYRDRLKNASKVA